MLQHLGEGCNTPQKALTVLAYEKDQNLPQNQKMVLRFFEQKSIVTAQPSGHLCASFSIGFSLSCRRQAGRFVVSLCRFLPGDAVCPARLIPFPVNL